MTYANNAVFTDQLDKLVLGEPDRVALSVGGDVAQVTNVADLIGRSTVGLTKGVD